MPATDPAWVEPAQRRVFRYLRCLRCPPDVADDLVQETMLASLRAVARNQWFSFCRQQRRELPAAELQRLHDRAVGELGDDGGDGAVAALRECVAALPPRSQRALQLCYGDDLPRGRAAKELGLRDEGLKTLLSRLRAALKACVEGRRSHE